MPSPDRSIVPGSRPMLLVSVSSLAEAEVALRGSADIIDLKDPRRGALGACDLSIWRDVVRWRDRVAPSVPLSAALGEAREAAVAPRAAAAATLGIDVVKAGLEGLSSAAEAVVALRTLVDAVRRGSRTQVVAATYADGSAGGALAVERLPEVSALAGAVGCLLDTRNKDGRNLLDHCAAGLLTSFLAGCRDRRLLGALAGSLTLPLLTTHLPLRPHILGVRGSVCQGGREGALDPIRLSRWRIAIDAAPPEAGFGTAATRPAAIHPESIPRRPSEPSPERAGRRSPAA